MGGPRRRNRRRQGSRETCVRGCSAKLGSARTPANARGYRTNRRMVVLGSCDQRDWAANRDRRRYRARPTATPPPPVVAACAPVSAIVLTTEAAG
jgi:hypothetical protein